MNTIPPIGIEIELSWSFMLDRVDEEAAMILSQASHGFYGLPDSEKARVQQGFDLVDMQYKDLVDGAFGPEIVRKADGYAEFAFRPKSDYRDLTEMTHGLYDSGVFVDGEDYPLHVTLGDVPARHGSWLVLMTAELSGGTTPERITEVNTWSQKGIAGVKERHPAELELDAQVGIELRTLRAGSAEGLEHTLAIIQLAGSVLLAKLDGSVSAIERWSELRNLIYNEALELGIDTSTKWQNPQQDQRPWQTLGLALSDHEWTQSMRSKIDNILLDSSSLV